MKIHEAFNEMIHRQESARRAQQEAALRDELIGRVRVAIKDVDDWNGQGDLFTHMAEAAVDAFADFYREGMKR